ncbi:alpha/beta hydrolase family protein [Acinetobacter sp. TSRC1-2]|uniref:alpha/beta hydrolase family protein n=1 Tax=unclassified Acinetobacter TaxID=196816 RepID=UPI003CF99EE0
MTDTINLATSTLNNIIDWLQGKEPLDRSEWSLELLKILDLEKQKEVYEKFLSLGSLYRVGKVKNYDLYTYFVDLEYASGNWFLSIKFNKNNQISSILLTPNSRAMSQHLAISEELNEFVREEYFEINITNNLGIEACITSPKKQTPTALVLFIQGSGASDKNENMGYCTPFFDLAVGLAKNNISSIRFDKRSWAYPFISVKDPTDEVINDAVCAANLIRQKIKASNLPLIILGHSQGGTFVTQVAERLDIFPHGFILLAAPSSNDLHSRLIDQLDYLIQKNSENEDSLLKMKNEVRESLTNWKSHTPERVKNIKLIFNYSIEYLSYLDAYNPIDVIRKANIPTLLLQGKGDYKVLENKDFVEWEVGLSINKNVTFKLYENLEHCFVDSKCAEKHTFAKVDSEVIKDISNWILTLSKL